MSSGIDTLSAGGRRLYTGARDRIGGIVNAVQTGWSGLRSGAQAAINSVGQAFGRAGSAVREVAGRVGNAIRSAAGRARNAVVGLADAARRQIGNAVRPITAVMAAIKAAALGLDAAAFRAAWSRAKAVAGQVIGAAGGALSWLGSSMGSVWNGLKGRMSSLAAGARRTVGAVTDRVRQLAAGVRGRLSSIWNGIRARAGGLSSVLSGLPAPVRALVDRLASGASGIWGRVQQAWDGLQSRVGGIAGRVMSGARSLLGRVGQGLSQVGGAATQLWQRASSAARRGVGRVVSGVRSVGSRIGSASSGFLDKLSGAFDGAKAIKAGVADPHAVMAPMVDGVAGQLQSGMPATAQAEAARRIGEAGIGGPGASAGVGAGPAIQRNPDPSVSPEARSTAWGSVWSGFSEALGVKWSQLDVWALVKHVLKSLIWPWPEVGREFTAMWSEWKATWNGFHLPRNIFSDPLGSLHDVYGQLMRVADFVLILWRHVNNILLLLWGWVTIALVILGAVGGSVAGGVIGGIVSAAASFGLAAPAGAGAGAGAGGITGAGAGLGAALVLGQAFVISFAAAEAANFVKRMADLSTVRQTDSEKADDFNSAADSVLALGILAVLVAIGYIGGRIAGAAIRRFPRLVPEFLRRPRVGEEVPPGEVKPGEVKPGEAKLAERPRSLTELRERLTPEGKEGFDQIRELQGDRAAEGQSNRFRRDDGTYDVDAADQYFRSKRLTPEQYEAKLAQREAQATQAAQRAIETIDNQIRQTSPEGRPGATIGDGTSEAALLHEAQTGAPVGGRGHSLKVRDAISSLSRSAEQLRSNLPKVRDAAMRARMEDAISRAEAKVQKMQPALDAWNNRVNNHPDRWNPDGTSKTTTNPDGSPWPSEAHRMAEDLR